MKLLFIKAITFIPVLAIAFVFSAYSLTFLYKWLIDLGVGRHASASALGFSVIFAIVIYGPALLKTSRSMHSAWIESIFGDKEK